MATDVQAFGAAFAAVWMGLAAYMIRLHVVERRLAREIERLTRPR